MLRLSESPAELSALKTLTSYLGGSMVSPLRKALTENEDPVAGSVWFRMETLRFDFNLRLKSR